MNQLSPDVMQAAQWLQSQSEENPYSEIGVKLILHNGVVSRIERLVISKTKPTDNGRVHETTRNYR